jgi:O-acetylhomoserine (thiol)-lyase
VKFVNQEDPQNFAKAVTDKTRALFVESIGNPLLDVADVGEIAKVAHERGLPLIVDATFTTPFLLRSIEHGADIVVNSLTKWMGGHGTGIGGIMTDSGRFDWKQKRFALFNQPDPNYHGLKWAHDLPPALSPVAYALRLRTVPLRNLGACISPDNAWIFLQGIERWSAHGRQRQAGVATADHPKVRVRYLAARRSDLPWPRYLKKGFGGMVVFGTRREGRGGEFINT